MSPSNDRRTTNSRPLPDPASQPTSPTSARTSRPLPVPTSTTVSGTPQTKGTTGTVNPMSFYGSTPNAREPPPLPARPDSARSEAPPWDEGKTGLGSKSTTYIPPETSSGASSPFRSPVLVPNSPHSAPPELIQDTTFDNNEWNNVTSAWNAPVKGDNGWNGNDDWGMSKAADWATNWGEPSFPFKITGRNVEEENSWWDTEARQTFSRPGSGHLPPAVMEMIFAEGGTLHHVEVALPDEGELTRGPSKTPEEYVGPSIEDLRSVIPHPSAYFSPQECAWMIVLPREYVAKPNFTSRDGELSFPPWPNTGFRNANADKPCGKDGANVAHHFHRYDEQIDVRELEPEAALLEGHDVEIKTLNAVACCQCPMVVLMSTPLSAIIPRTIMDTLAEEREDSPQPGQTKHDSVATAFNTLHIVIANRLWKNEERLLPVDGDSMLTRKMGTNDNVKKLFELLGFQLDKETSRPGLRPPRTDLSTPEGKLNRAKLLRAYIEVGAYMHRYYQKHGSQIKDSRHVNTIRIERATDHLQIVIGADAQTLPRDGPDFLYQYGPQQSLLNHLGITVPSATYECMAFAYLSQQRCDPERAPEYFEILQSYVNSAQLIGHEVPEWFQKMILNERERGRYTPEDFANACKTFGFGPDGSLGVELDDADLPFLMLAFRHALENSGVLQRELTDQFRVLLRARGVRAFMDAFNKHVETGLMTVDDAYRLLQATADVDEGMLIITAEMNASDSPSQADRIRDAISLIAESRNSHRLRKFLEVGVDPGEIMAPVRADMPRGLNQLGNTCYLNSLLQYFYTIKNLRDAVLQLSRVEVDKVEDDDTKLTEDNLKKHRVGGRLVTLKEIKRSRRFVKLLGELFWHMEHSEDPSITPALDLAKLALVTSKDEEEDSGTRPSTDASRTSADTDATLVDDLQMVTSPRAGSPQSQGSILGKRTRGAEAASESGDVEMGDVTPAPTATPLVARKSTQIVDSGMMFGRQHDVAECMDNCMFQIETALLRFDDLSLSEADKASIVKSLFYGTLRQTISGNDSTRSKKSSHEKTDLFAHLPVQVSDEGHDLYDGLSGYFDDLVEFEGRQQRMEVTLVDLPPIIQIQLHRVQFDRETMQAYKNNAYVKFDETIRLDRFLDQADAKKRLEAKHVQSELASCRARIEVLSKGKLAPAGPALLHVADFLTTCTDIRLPDVKQDMIMHLPEEETLITEELRVLRAQAGELKANLEAIWASSESRAEYELTSVFIHRGTSPTFGHYFFYARNLPDHPDQWFKYNDAEVTEVGKDEVFADTTGQTANPYLLVYAQAKSRIINTVNRACDVADKDKLS